MLELIQFNRQTHDICKLMFQLQNNDHNDLYKHSAYSGAAYVK